jgi:hypothetical protein
LLDGGRPKLLFHAAREKRSALIRETESLFHESIKKFNPSPFGGRLPSPRLSSKEKLDAKGTPVLSLQIKMHAKKIAKSGILPNQTGSQLKVTRPPGVAEKS